MGGVGKVEADGGGKMKFRIWFLFFVAFVCLFLSIRVP